MSGRHAMKDGGFALIAAIWLVVAISAVALDMSVRAKQVRMAGVNVAEEAGARAAARSGIREAQIALDSLIDGAAALRRGWSGERVRDAWAAADTLRIVSELAGGGVYTVTARDVGARLHLNRASEAELRLFFGALGVDWGVAETVAASIMDWKDPDDLRRARGAERDDYLEAGMELLPANAPFERLDELRHVYGVTEEIYRAALPHLTLVGSGRVNLNTADVPVLLTLPGMTDEAAAMLLRRRAEGRPYGGVYELALDLSPPARASLEQVLPELTTRTTAEVRQVHVVSEGRIEGSPMRYRVEALFHRDGGRAHLAWRRIAR